jgi:hypothetical protein
MALWQFTLDLIPAQAARVQGVEAIRLDPEQLDRITLGLSGDEEPELFDMLGKLMAERKGWTTKLRFYGDEESNDAQVSFDDTKVVNVQFRLDVYDLSLPLIGGICALARRFSCVLVCRAGGAVIQPSCEAILREVLQSPAARFVRDLEGYLADAIRLDGHES